MTEIILSCEPLIRQNAAPSPFRPWQAPEPAGQPCDASALLEYAVSSGARGLLTLYDPGLLGMLKAMRLGDQFAIYPLVPNMPQYIRDMSSGVVSAGLKRVRRLQPTDLVTIGLRNALRARGTLRRDFRAVIPIMLEMELAGFRRFRPKVIFLHAQLTDLLVAAGNARLLHYYAQLVRRTYGAEPALQTRNLGYVWPRLKAWQVDISTVVAPFNASGYRMKPTPYLCEKAALVAGLSLLAEDVDAGGSLPLDDALAYLSGWDFSAAVVTAGTASELDRILHLASDSSAAGSVEAD